MGLFKKRIDTNLTQKAVILIEEVQRLTKIINSTTSEKIFNDCFIRLREIFSELKQYESHVNFEGSPKKELALLTGKKNSAHNELLKRQRNNITSTLPDNFDPLFADAGRYIIFQNKASIGMLQRIFAIGFNRACHIMDQLCEYGVVGDEEGTRPRKILMDMEVFEKYLIELSSNSHFTNKNVNHASTSTVDFDNMEGHDFEYFCADLLRKNGFVSVEVTQGSGDHGIDILAEKDDITYAIQCKCYSSNIGNAAIQQAHTGKSLYHKDISVVMTNQYFTQQAKDEATQLGVKLWDRNRINELIKKAMS